jgi:uncharacterized protein (TIGR03086 family)
MSTETLKRVYGEATRVLGHVSKDELGSPTPCKSWDVSALVNHMVGATYFFATAAETGVGESEDAESDFASADFTSSFAEGSRLATAAFGADGVMDKTIKLPFGEFPGAAVMNIAAVDCFMHVWDLAKATGQPTDLDPEVAEQLLAVAEASIPDAFRGEEPAPFGPIVAVPASAPAIDRFAGFMGRTP